MNKKKFLNKFWIYNITIFHHFYWSTIINSKIIVIVMKIAIYKYC